MRKPTDQPKCFEDGARVAHDRFGPGSVVEAKATCALVQFDQGDGWPLFGRPTWVMAEALKEKGPNP